MQFSTDRAPQRKRDFAHLISGDGLAGSPSEFDASYQEYMKQKSDRNKELARINRDKKKSVVQDLLYKVDELERKNRALQCSSIGGRKSTTEMCDLSFDDDFSDRVMRGVEALRKLSGSNSQAFYVINAASYFFPIICASPGLVELTGYSMHEIIGQNCGFLCGQQTSIIEREKLNNALQSGQDASTTMLNYRRNGSTWWNELNLINLHTTSHDGTTAPDIIVGLHTEYSGEGSPSPLSAVTPSITPAFIPSAFCGGSEQDDDTSVLREILTKCLPQSASDVLGDSVSTSQLSSYEPSPASSNASSHLKLPNFQFLSPMTAVNTLANAARTAPPIAPSAQAESKEVCTPTVLAGHLSKEQQQQKQWPIPSRIQMPLSQDRNSAFSSVSCKSQLPILEELYCRSPIQSPRLFRSARSQASPIIFPASTNPDGVSGIKREEASGIKREEAFKSPARPFPVRYGVDSIGKQSPLQQTQQQPTPPQPQQQQQQQQLGVLSNSGAFEFDLDMDMELSLLMDSTDE